MSKIPLGPLGHTPMWLRIVKGKLHCVKDPRFNGMTLRLKPYRARHYVQRVNIILKVGPGGCHRMCVHYVAGNGPGRYCATTS